MAWSEARGYTLILTHPRGPDRYARVALVTKRTLFGKAYNVRVARAEDATRSGKEPEALGYGRMLSWRWLGEAEAEQLLSARLRTLEALGYTVLGKGEPATRGPWDWLRELVQRQLERPTPPPGADADANTEAEAEAPEPATELAEALSRLGLEPDSIMEGLAKILELDEQQLRAPTPATLRELEPELLALILPVWLSHDSEQLRAVGARWLELPATPYELELGVLERWVGAEGPLARALAPRLEREALALLGPETLARLAHTAAEPRVKAIACDWRARLD